MSNTKTIKTILAAAAIALIFTIGIPHTIFAQTIGNPSNTLENAAISANATETQEKEKQHFFSWAVLFLAVGEFAGLIGKGISSIHNEKRAEKQRVTAPAEKVKELTYEEHKQGIYNENSVE